jgi:hypothetical protein
VPGLLTGLQTLWSGFTTIRVFCGTGVRLFIDTPMHLLFLGIAKAMFFKFGVWAAKAGRGPAFNAVAIDLLGKVEQLHLQWLTFNVKTFGKWGGWVSEKYQSLARISLWVYGPLLVVDKEPIFSEPVDRDVKSWRLDQYRNFLKCRGMSEVGTKDELRDRVIEERDKPEDEKSPFIQRDCGPAEGLLNVLRSMVLMLTTMLQPRIEGDAHADILALRVRLFLSNVEAFDSHLRKRKVNIYHRDDPSTTTSTITNKRVTRRIKETRIVEGKPEWLAKSIFLCLLNLAETIREFGPARNYFEGKYIGERYVQEVKTTRTKCPSVNVNKILLLKLHQGKAMEAMMDSQSGKVKTFRSTDSHNTSHRELTGNVRVYKSRDIAITSYSKRRPISMVVTDTHGCGILFYVNGCNRGKVSFATVTRLDQEDEIENGLKYCGNGP